MPSRQIPPRLSHMLDAARATAALAVVAQHARTYLFVGPAALREPSWPIRAFYFLTGFGHQAVMVFFVLSGFLVGGSALSAIEADRWSWSSYLTKRVTRLAIVLVPALLLTLAWDRSLVAQFGVHMLPWRDHSITIASHTWTVRSWSLTAMFGNALFLMNVLVPTFGTNGALWSLANEFWYYVAFPLAALAVVRRRDSMQTVTCLVALVLLYTFLGRDIAAWGTIWLMGVIVARAPVIRIPHRTTARALLLASGLLCTLVLWRDRDVTTGVSLTRDVILGIAFAVALYSARCALARASDAETRDAEHASPRSMFARLAAFSYTLYLVHEPPLAFAQASIRHRDHASWQPTAPHVALYAAAVIALVVYARAIALVTEDRTDTLRNAVRSVLARRPIRFTGYARIFATNVQREES